jgi:hypothetical protein
VRARLAQQIRSVARDAHHVEFGLLKNTNDALADQRLVIADHDSDRHAPTLLHGDIPMALPAGGGHAVRVSVAITPDNALERNLLADPRLQAGLDWGTPRFGHPEGRVREHVGAMLAAIADDDPFRSDLRFLALTHDSFKAEVRPLERWSQDNDHAMRARRFAERYTSDERLLATLELHDEPYWIWRTADAPEEALRALIDRLPDPELFVRFVELDAANQGKDLTFLWWFRREMAIAGRLPGHSAALPDGDAENILYVKTFATSPEQQPAVQRAARALITEQRDKMQAQGEVLTSDDGQRVVLLWRWHGSRRELIDRDAGVIREGLAAHPILADSRAVQARVFHAASGA